MKKKAPEEKVTKASKARRAALKAASKARRKAHYGAQFTRTETNRRRRMRRHIRAHPEDALARNLYEKKYTIGSAAALGLTCKGKKRQRVK